jgi:amidase
MQRLARDAALTTLSPDHPPAATVADGATVVFETLDSFGGLLTDESHRLSDIGGDVASPATGPLVVEGARPGDTLRVEIVSVAVGDRGVVTTHPDFGILTGQIGEATHLLDIVDGEVVLGDGLRLPVEPVVGLLGTAPARGDVTTSTATVGGGKMDNRRIGEGAVVYLPVEVEGALLAIGGVHAAVADGQVGLSGLEVSAEVTVRVTVVPGRPLPLPFVASESLVMTIASETTLDSAATVATEAMHGLLDAAGTLGPDRSAMLLSLAGQLAICQVVDPYVTCRMELPRDLAEAAGVVVP